MGITYLTSTFGQKVIFCFKIIIVCCFGAQKLAREEKVYSFTGRYCPPHMGRILIINFVTFWNYLEINL